ncbi:ArsR/SmtB family transcription factor [Cohaesibacter celericrescens]|uniref:Transcriptional regulator n=1 Tax=Cohaesibacter celericrescens TaxID=2067669 RepID=A0A2N5XL48_9HYPH|nr:helix-turn-helix domain-containing protein [Cohaesibacter celericrescens]PLW75266.1 transcriptional regulator [Cohaesibacter celericrescens]
MDNAQATTAFAALSQQTRLDVFRLLIKAGADGLLSGEMGEILAVKQNTMSTNLNILLRAGLIRNQRHGRSVRYFADMQGIGGLIDYLLQDCCGGAPDQCKPIISTICGPNTNASKTQDKTE